jgi:hypothetical protein
MANATAWLKQQRVIFFKNSLLNTLYKILLELDGVDNEDYWVYGTDSGTPGKFHWCSTGKKFEPREIAWAPGEPKNGLHCVYLKNKGVNQTVLATADCDTEKKFLCDVRKTGTHGKSMQQECVEIWGISNSDLFPTPHSNFITFCCKFFLVSKSIAIILNFHVVHKFCWFA